MINSTITLAHNGRILSFLDLSSLERKWTHYLSDDSFIKKRDFTEDRMTMGEDSEEKLFGHQPYEVKEIHFFGVK